MCNSCKKVSNSSRSSTGSSSSNNNNNSNSSSNSSSNKKKTLNKTKTIDIFSSLRPKEYTVTSFELAVTHVTRMNTRHHKCNEDPGYDVVQCFERCAQEKAG